MDGGDIPRICDVPLAHLPLVWPRVEEFVARGLAEDGLGRYTIADVYKELVSGRIKLWVAYDSDDHVFDAAMVTEIAQYPQCRECNIWALGGQQMGRWLNEWVTTIENYARAHGCIRLSTRGRKGWVKVAGAKSVGEELVKPLWGAVT